uniref:DEP domain-containing protein n=1 Tax=Chromera velia CCMP2878 TaxID=1169474 RepID=A0A0G4GTY6_9ALVE|eukprot:Cvel_23329.t1-p1 / transcript=Cvel_23329.t1 / gene=Cvel_23329 / organism=Chromera_velia_CCMP2878 / gene_product=Glutaredoxin, putative / transcript_product=Glutaredoxin, putative / location=Cvel_scaffold2390:19645-24880(-) / protein_length=538 / sequence_SO=supercontig / SO=protein_coding / is_pseudo=false
MEKGNSADDWSSPVSAQTNNRIVVFSIHGCPHCARAKSLLKSKNWPFEEINISDYPQKRNDMVALCDRLTVPQIFFGAFHVGGNAELQELEKAGKLQGVFQKELIDAPPHNDSRLQKPEGPPEGSNVPVSLPEEPSVDIKGTQYTYSALYRELRGILDVKDRWYNLRTYKNCFVGQDFVTAIMERFGFADRGDAVITGQKILDTGLFHHVVKDHTLKDEYLFYRFQSDEESPALLNKRALWPSSREVPDPWVLLKGLKKALNKLQSRHQMEDGSFNVKAAAGDEEWTVFVHATAGFQKTDLGSMGEDERLAFVINLYNLAVIHAFVAVGVPFGNAGRYQFFDAVAYEIGGHRFSLNDLENGVLRNNTKTPLHLSRPFSSGDKRLSACITEPDCRIHFALNCGAKSCPPVKSFSKEAVREELRVAALAFFEDDANLDVSFPGEDEETEGGGKGKGKGNGRKQGEIIVTLSKILGWFSADFGKDDTAVLKKVVSLCGGKKKERLQTALDSGAKIEVRHSPYDWDAHVVNAKEFKFAFMGH